MQTILHFQSDKSFKYFLNNMTDLNQCCQINVLTRQRINRG